MEQFVLVPLPVYSSSNSPTIVTKQELPKHKPEQTPTYHKDMLKKEINQQLSTSASPLVNKILETPRIKLSKGNTLIVDGIEIGLLLRDFAQRLKLKNVPIPDIYLLYLTQPASLPTLLSTVMPRVKKEGLGSLSKSEWQKLQRLYTQGFSFCPSKIFKSIKQTTWNTNRLHGIAWSSGKLEYEKLFAVLYDIKVMNAEVFAKRFEKCRLLTRLLRQSVEKLDDYGCPKIQDLVGQGKANSSCICSSYPFRHKTRLRCAERKAKVYGDWEMQHLNL